MDFAEPLVEYESVVSKSKVRHIPLEHAQDEEIDDLDILQHLAANKAAKDMVLGPVDSEDSVDLTTVDTALFTDRLFPLQSVIHEGDLVVILESFDNLAFTYAKAGEILNNRNGAFHHNDFIGKPFGCKIRSRSHRGYGFVHLLKPTPELWARSLNHRTQIVHELDQSQVTFHLDLKPNMTVVESGTGSGAMSYSILRTIAPHGQLHTYEFNEVRAKTARQEFSSNSVDHLVTVHHKDVCGKQGDGGFDLPGQSVDAVFLDLPEPWLAVPHAAHILRCNGRLASYSPCVEQTQKTVEALQKLGFHSMKTMEFRQQEFYVDKYEYGSPPTVKRPKFQNTHHRQYSAKDEINATAPKDVEENVKNDAEEAAGGDNTMNKSAKTSLSTEKLPVNEKEKPLVARPFVNMRGHTAFLTFCSAGNVTHRNPTDSAEK